MKTTTTLQSPNPGSLAHRLASYAAGSLRPDLVAGFTVAMVAVPQAMAYAAIAGVNPIYGLYTAILPAIIAALFGSSRHLNTGPTNGIALVTIGVLLPVVQRADYVEYVFAIAILSGAIRLALGVFRLGGIIRYVSNSVLTGFLTGASILIVLNQLGNLLGLPRTISREPLSILLDALRDVFLINPFTAITGMATIVLLVVIRQLNMQLPAPLLAIVGASVGVEMLDLKAQGVELVSNLGSVQVMLAFHLPQIDPQYLEMLVAGGGAVALLGLVEPMSVAKSLAATSGQRIDSSREFVGQGLASLVGGFFQCIPASGSLSRSAVNFSSGAQTQIASIFSGVFVFLAALVFAPWLGFIPTAALAGIVVVAAAKMIDVKHIQLTWSSHTTSRITLLVTLVATLLLPLHYAIYLGVVLSIGLYLYESGKIQLSYLIEDDGQFIERSYDDLLKHPVPIAIIHVEGTLYFGAADELERRLDALFQSGVKVVILRLRRVHHLASTGIIALERIAASAKRNGARVILCGVRTNLIATLQSAGVVTLFGRENIFEANDMLFESTRAALQRAKQIQEGAHQFIS
ncbi:MAG: SulP family inorganic anion transporter [Chloroflexi bacterium]|nr:SulP family inorganic anion transporter [Chloroflexota bacterium]